MLGVDLSGIENSYTDQLFKEYQQLVKDQSDTIEVLLKENSERKEITDKLTALVDLFDKRIAILNQQLEESTMLNNRLIAYCQGNIGS